MNKSGVKVLRIISTCLLTVAVVLAFLISGVRLLGFQVFGVLSGSMEPTYPTGSLIYVRKVEQSDLRVNDIITFSKSPSVIATHRIVELVPDENNPSLVRYRTKGDANSVVDNELVSFHNVIGRASFCVPQLGYMARYIQSPPGIYVALIVCAAMVAIVFYADMLEIQSQKKRKKKNRQRSPETMKTAPAQKRVQYRQDDEDYEQSRPYSPQGYGQPRQYSQQQSYGQPRQYAPQNYGQQRQASQQSYSQQRQYTPQNYGQQRQAPQQGYNQQGQYTQQNYAQQRQAPYQSYGQPRQQYSPQQGYSQPRQQYSPQQGYEQQRQYPRRSYGQQPETTRKNDQPR